MKITDLSQRSVVSSHFLARQLHVCQVEKIGQLENELIHNTEFRGLPKFVLHQLGGLLLEAHRVDARDDADGDDFLLGPSPRVDDRHVQTVVPESHAVARQDCCHLVRKHVETVRHICRPVLEEDHFCSVG